MSIFKDELLSIKALPKKAQQTSLMESALQLLLSRQVFF